MNWLPNFDQLDLLTKGASQNLLQTAMLQFIHFTLVVFRLSGLMMTAPGFSHNAVPVHIRILIIVAIAQLVAPNLAQLSQQGFDQLDLNADRILQPDEIPPILHPRVKAIKLAQGMVAGPEDSLSASEYSLMATFPSTMLDYLWIVVGELGLGMLLGLGVMTILSALQMTGQIIDQQTGTNLGEVFNPELNSSVSVSGEMLYLLGTTIFLALGGHQLLIDSLLHTYRTFPPGQAFISDDAISLASDLIHQSLILALQISAPVMATMSIVTLAMGFLGHSVPQINILVFGFPVKVLAGFLVLGLALSGMGEVIADSVPQTVETLRTTLSGLEQSHPDQRQIPSFRSPLPKGSR